MRRPDMKAIRARADAATAGPWRAGHHDTHLVFGAIGEPTLMAPVLGRVVARANENFRFEDDMKFIAAARTDVPALCDRVEALERTLREIEPVLDRAVSAACAEAPPDLDETLDALDAVRNALGGDE